MQMCLLRLQRICPTSAPSELLFQQSKDFFNLLTDGIKFLHSGRSQAQIVRQQKSRAVFDNQDLVIDSFQLTLLSAVKVAK